LRRFEASVTGFAHRYRHDIFYRTGWNVVVLQVAFAVVLVVLTLISLSLLYDKVVEGLIRSLVESVASGSNPAHDGIYIAAMLEYEKQKNMVLTASGILVAATTFSWLVTTVALRPAHIALQSQKQFVGNIAHELRTPLSILKTNIEVALFSEKIDRGLKETLSSNLEELDRISDIINNLLSMNALLNPSTIVFENVDLGPVIERVMHTLSALADQKKINVSALESGYRTVRGNAVALEQMLLNVVKNAIYFTPLGGSVTISIKPDYHGQVEVEIRDTGMGIPAKELDRVFEPFYRGDKARNRAGGIGSGLGLAIVGELVRAHKGKVRIRSTEGRGTTVTITLPAGFNEPRHAPSAGEGESSIQFS
jgi:signal transduction histidine kinase